MIEISIASYWLIAGALLVVAEVAGITGIGCFFAGLGTLVVGLLLEGGIIPPNAYFAQFAWFFAATTVWAILLWKPLKKWLHHTPPHSAQGNMIGDTARVGPQGLQKGSTGEAIWSGTAMRAEIAAHCTVERIEPGAQVRICEVRGVTLLVEPT